VVDTETDVVDREVQATSEVVIRSFEMYEVSWTSARDGRDEKAPQEGAKIAEMSEGSSRPSQGGTNSAKRCLEEDGVSCQHRSRGRLPQCQQ
jgi:hypothetical protein